MILIPQKVKDTLKKRWWWYILEFSLFAIVLTLDLVSKHLLVKKMGPETGREEVLIKGLLNLTYEQNTGGAFSAFSSATTMLTVVTSLLLIGIGVFLILDLKQGLQIRIPLVLIIGGGMGNLVDRIKFKYVRDFFKFSFNWGIFNIADVFISNAAVVLVIVLIVQLVKEFKKGKPKEESTETNPSAQMSNSGIQELGEIDETSNNNLQETNQTDEISNKETNEINQVEEASINKTEEEKL